MSKYVQNSYNLYIDGKWVPASDGKTFKEYNPSNGELLSTVAEATKDDVDTAVKAAAKALETWKHTSPIERQNLLLKIAEIIDANAEHLAMVETLDNGKPLRELLRELNSHFRADMQSVTNTSIMYPLITDICRESTPEKGIVLSEGHIRLMDTVMRFNYEYIYKSKRLEIYHNYARLILESIYKLLRECYAGGNTMDNIRRLAEDYPTLGRHFEKRMKKYSDIGRAEGDTREYGNTVIYRIDTSEDDYKTACIDYIAGMTDTYAEKIFDELTTF